MAKPTTGRVEHVPEPDPDQMAADTLMTSVFSGICLIAATIVLAVVRRWSRAGRGPSDRQRDLARSSASRVGLALGMAVIAWALRRYADRIRARSNNLYRGAWIGSVAALAIIVLMYFLPQVAIPQYCPPGKVCVNNTRS